MAAHVEELIRAKADERGWEIVELELMPDHVHLFVEHDAKASAPYVANQFKVFTSPVLRAELLHLKLQRYIERPWERPWKKKRGEQA